MKLAMLFASLALVIGAAGFEPASDIAPASDTKPRALFESCPKAEYADCTRATCKPGSKPGILSCTCPIRTNDSVTVSVPGCVSATTTTVQSRYHPVAAYGQCVNRKKTWAACLGVMCRKIPGTDTVDCRCKSAVSEQYGSASYVIVTNSPYASQCTNGTYYSSATPEEVAQISTFLQRIPPRNLWFYPPEP